MLMIYIGYWLKHTIYQKQRMMDILIKHLIYGKYVSSLVTKFSYIRISYHMYIKCAEKNMIDVRSLCNHASG